MFIIAYIADAYGYSFCPSKNLCIYENYFMRHIIITNALPYANGPLHLGHILAYVNSDIWYRYLKMQGNTCYSICGSDMHGTPIMISARNKGLRPEDMVFSIEASHKTSFAKFNICFDHYHSTHHALNESIIVDSYQKLLNKQLIISKDITQAYDVVENMFLPDRFVEGTCPKCRANNQYGDGCEACGATYSTQDLINSKSKISGTPPIFKPSENKFFCLDRFADQIRSWGSKGLTKEIFHSIEGWLDSGLKDWSISRDDPYFGFKIPNTEPQKYFYVWLDAPLGYIACFQDFCNKNHISFDDYWKADSDYEVHHYCGKDISYFHTLFWPALLMALDYRLPTSVKVHGFLTINKEKMSKSKQTFLLADDYAEVLDTDYLRFYFAARINSGITDTDLDLGEFESIVNNHFIGKIINIASRCGQMLDKHFDSQLSAEIIDENLLIRAHSIVDEISICYERNNFSHAMSLVLDIADLTNQFINEHKPWLLVKQTNLDCLQAHAVCSLGINIFKIIIGCLKPVMPSIALMVEKYLNNSIDTWADIKTPLKSLRIQKFTNLASRITSEQTISLKDRMQKN